MPNHCCQPTGDFYEEEAKTLIAGLDDLMDWDDGDALCHYLDAESWYYDVSEGERLLRHDRLIQDYEFEERGGLLPGDRVMAKICTRYWKRGTVLLVGIKTVVVTCDVQMEDECRSECFEVDLNQATWMPE